MADGVENATRGLRTSFSAWERLRKLGGILKSDVKKLARREEWRLDPDNGLCQVCKARKAARRSAT
jgi:hypothetical protein